MSNEQYIVSQKFLKPNDQELEAVEHHSVILSSQAYYRANTITTQQSINPLVAAATTITTLSTKLRQANHYSDVTQLRSQLIQEVQAFETNSRQQHYRRDTLLVARYLLCCCIDEAILSTAWGQQQNWQDYSLLAQFHEDQLGTNRFIEILEQINQDADIDIDLLELIYVILSLGFHGKHFEEAQTDSKIEMIIDNLYQKIRLQRGDFDKRLTSSHDTDKKTKPKLHHRFSAFGLSASATLLGVVGLYFGYQYLLSIATEPLLHLSQLMVI